jgi:hypothetical protein
VKPTQDSSPDDDKWQYRKTGTLKDFNEEVEIPGHVK